jgi:hypothetical protein
MDDDFSLVRVARIDHGAFGVLRFNHIPFAVTLERTFDAPGGGQRVVVPTGVVQCRRSHYFKGGYETFELIVPGHDRVLFHKANVETELKACIAVAESFADLDPAPGLQLPGVADSRGGFSEFMRLAAGRQQFPLKVTEVNDD